MNDYDDKCIDHYDGDCAGDTELRWPLSGTGISYPRCDHHWILRCEMEDKLRERYPYHAPSDFDPAYAGETWGDDY
jgi:hypothetical protein